MPILNTSIEDSDEIFRLYKLASEYQKNKGVVRWPEFSKTLIENDIADNRQWKIVVDNTIACIWTITFDDPLIWEEKNKDPAIYIHRIATNPKFKGNNLVKQIVKWAQGYAIQNNKKFIRMDTVGENTTLIQHYQRCGFDFLGLVKLHNTHALPAHYHNASVSLFELNLERITENQ
ncbi:MAG: GNAT family N-acetyltransferase [Undibacterium sp.]|nr:GNAT family N-acetyltransferase [Undibacterium sp.]